MRKIYVPFDTEFSPIKHTNTAVTKSPMKTAALIYKMMIGRRKCCLLLLVFTPAVEAPSFSPTFWNTARYPLSITVASCPMQSQASCGTAYSTSSDGVYDNTGADVFAVDLGTDATLAVSECFVSTSRERVFHTWFWSSLLFSTKLPFEIGSRVARWLFCTWLNNQIERLAYRERWHK